MQTTRGIGSRGDNSVVCCLLRYAIAAEFRGSGRGVRKEETSAEPTSSRKQTNTVVINGAIYFTNDLKNINMVAFRSFPSNDKRFLHSRA